ncbi:MAG: hypothetical protein ABIS86_22045, partial [Streptosporangiaceae bacterium]
AVTQAVAYNLPITGSNAPIDLSGTATAAWSQTSDLPVTGAAIFPASHVPARGGDGYYQPGSGDWKYADLSYLDVNGRTVNTASFGSGAWQANATRYDKDGRIIWALTAENRARALTPTSETDPYVAGRNTSAERADLLATVSTYNSSGDVITTTGPTRRLQLDSGTTVSARDLTENTYDEGRPDKSIDYHLVTTSKISPLIVDGAETPTIADSRVAKNGYAALAAGDSSGWELRNPTSVTKVMASGTDLITRTRYDRAGRVVETRQPASDGTDAGTTVTVFYTADTNPDVAACGLKPQWAGQICQTGPKAQPTGKTLPAETRSYGYYGQTTKAVETSGGTTRTTISTYDDAGRPTGTSLAVTPSAEGGQSVPESTTTYNQSTGLAQSNSAGGKTITTAHDSFGRVTSYADGTGNTATTTYTVDSQIATVNDGKGTYTYTYDGNDRWDREEHRGLVTQIDAGLPNSAGVIRSGYNGDGKLTGQWQATAQTWSVRRYDARGEETALGYGGGDGSTWLWFSQGSTVHGQTAWQSGPAGTQDFLYDNAGRLKKILDRYQGQCNVRT